MEEASQSLIGANSGTINVSNSKSIKVEDEFCEIEIEKKLKKTTNKEYVIDENAIGLLIFENGRSINIYTTTKNFYLNKWSFKLDNNSILNEYGNSILLGHNHGNFSEINNLKIGDSLLIKTHKNNLKYKR